MSELRQVIFIPICISVV